MLETVAALIIFACLVIYSVTGGADFGGGVWDLFATGPRAKDQRDLIARAIAPIWEANHVWLIAVIVFLFVGFPKAFAVISTALHVPLTLLLLGIVFRGAAFVFRRYGLDGARNEKIWSVVFAVASIVAPLAMGLTVGAIVSGTMTIDPASGLVQTDFISSWLAPFPVALGFFVLALFSFLAAVYLTGEAQSAELKDDFRMRAIVSGVAVGALAWLCFFLSAKGAPMIWWGLSHQGWSWPFHLLTGLAAVAALGALIKNWFFAARILAPLQVILVILGWGLTQFPHLVFPDLTITNAAAPQNVLRALVIIFCLGAMLIVPAFAALYWVFKKESFK